MRNFYFSMMYYSDEIFSAICEKLKEEEGAGVIEVAVIILILIGLALIFKEKVTELLDSIFGNINSGLPTLGN